MPSVSSIGLEGSVPVESIIDRFSAYLHSRFHQKITSVNTESEPGNDDDIPATELDSHANSPVVRRYPIVLEDTGRKAIVTGFTSELG